MSTCGYYVDKTRFIKDLFDTALLVKVQLFTRPRRFGKTLFLSLLKAFLEPNYKDKSDLSEHEKIFKDLDIFKDKEFCDEFMGKYPVI